MERNCEGERERKGETRLGTMSIIPLPFLFSGTQGIKGRLRCENEGGGGGGERHFQSLMARRMMKI